MQGSRKILASFVVLGVVCTALVAIVTPFGGSSLARKYGSGFLSEEALEATEQQFTDVRAPTFEPLLRFSSTMFHAVSLRSFSP